MKTTIVLICSLFMLLACSKKDQLPKAYDTPSLKNGALTYADFQKYLKADMDFISFTTKFGMPLKDIGSGIHIYVYELTDSTEVWIGYTTKILYARHMNDEHVVVDTLI